MVENNKRKKHHDKDKYYRLAKEQGLRSRAAFKLSQINRKHHLLTSQTKTVLDLCAAPGGWTQIASRTIPPTGSLILAVDILPIRPIGRNVMTLIGDITTGSCQSLIKRELQGASIDVVLCDGAPNVGASYDKDAYNQNEISLAALKCATHHLKPDGSFLTKLYRSRDYASYLWVVKQFFRTVEAVKPAASRMASAEMFLVCKGYLAPDKIDPKMLDPKAVFGEVEREGGEKAMSVFHKKYGEQKKNRGGYDMTKLDATMRNLGMVRRFVEGSDPISILSECTGLTFTCGDCSGDKKTTEGEGGEDVPKAVCLCQKYLNHVATNDEIKACLPDLKVLNKSDFKGLIAWRLKLRQDIFEKPPGDDDDDDEKSASSGEEDDHAERNSSDEENDIQKEIADRRLKKLRKKKREKKKERRALAKKRRRAAMGMESSAVDLPTTEKIFSLAQINDAGDLEAVREVNLDEMSDSDSEGGESDLESQGEKSDADSETGYDYRLDRELDADYERYLSKTKNAEAKQGTKMAKRAKKKMATRVKDAAAEDVDIERNLDDETKAYAELLTGKKDSDDSSDDDDKNEDDQSDDGFHAEPRTPSEHTAALESRKKEGNPLIHLLPEEPQSVKTARWFQNPLFKDMQSMADQAAIEKLDNKNDDDVDMDSVHNDDDDDDDEEDDDSSTDGKGLDADEVLSLMPKTEKQKRHDKRIKDRARREKREERRAKRMGETPDLEIVQQENDNNNRNDDDEEKALTPQQRAKIEKARRLIKAGMGTTTDTKSTKNNDDTFEIAPLPTIDTRTYNSDSESYDSDDHARTLALGTMLLRRSKAKALIDASYNAYAWNDPPDLPEWFVDDERKYYRPQLPIPAALVQKMKERYLDLSAKPIKKVAEARARKGKRARHKLLAAKKKAEAVANSGDMSEAMKLKAISKAMRGGADSDKGRPGRTYVVAKKGSGKAKGGKGIQLVDKRLKNDKRSLKRSEKKRKHGKQGGMTGSKRRRNHK